MVDTNGAFSLIVNSVSVIHALLSNTVGKVTCESAAVDVGPDWSGSQIKIRRRVALPEHFSSHTTDCRPHKHTHKTHTLLFCSLFSLKGWHDNINMHINNSHSR